jgi:predicted deacylase
VYGAPRVLRHLDILLGPALTTEDNQRCYDTFTRMRAEVAGLVHPTWRLGMLSEQGSPSAASRTTSGKSDSGSRR